MEYLVQQLINGVTLGAIYGLIAIGYTMVYGIIGMINFAHGDIFMIGAFLSLIALLALSGLGITSIPIALALTLIFAAALAALYGWTVERTAYRPLRGSFRLAPLISAIGMSIVLQNFAQVSQGARVKPIEPIVTGGLQLMEQDGFAGEIGAVGCQRQLHALHGPGEKGIEGVSPEPTGEGIGLGVAAGGQAHVDAAAEDAMEAFLDLGVTDEIEAGLHFGWIG